MANWATAAEVLALTGQTVTDAQITAANGLIDTFANVTDLARDNLSARDLRLLSKATGYQAVWMAAQVDVLTRVDVKRIQQDAMDVVPGNDDAMFLAPLAKRCLDRLSWRKSRSVRITRGEVRYSNMEAYQAAWLRDGAGTTPGWSPL